MPISPARFHKLVLNWFDHHGRKNLPWQQNKTPYKVWLSEIMLQQTQVATVIPYFQRFITQFPHIDSLACAHEDEVLHLWSGLGYYTRARNLHRTAKIIQHEFNGHFPQDLEELQKLPGIGRSTAGAILSSAFDKKATILDGNVKRLLTRLHAITGPPNDKSTLDQLWKLAEKYTPEKRVADYTQVMMDLGATVCLRKNPICDQCPVAAYCAAKKLDIRDQLPTKKQAKNMRVRQISLIILCNQDRVLLQKRPAIGIWGGLWSLPEMMDKPLKNHVKNLCKQLTGGTMKNLRVLEQFRHTFTHFHLDISPIQVKIESLGSKVMDSEKQIWYSLRQPEKIGLPAPVKLLLSKIL